MPNTLIAFNTKHPMGLLRSRAQGKDAGRYLLEALQSAVSGQDQCDGILWSSNDTEAVGALAYLGQAVGGIFLLQGTATGTVGAVIRGVTSTVTYATSAIATASALVAQFNALATINRVVCATNLEMVATLTSCVAGDQIRVCGVPFTGIAGAVPTTKFGLFSIDTDDTAAALSLATAINRHPSLALRYRAWSALGVVHIVRTTKLGIDPNNKAAGFKFEGLVNPGPYSTIALTVAKPTATANITILAAVPGDIGNEVRLTATGTGVTALTNGTTGFLGQGTGGGTIPFLTVP